MTEMTDYQRLIATSRYARWRDQDNRREHWDESVARYAWYWSDKGLIDEFTMPVICRGDHS